MVQILKSPGFGTRIAESLGTGLSQLANSKLQQIQQQHQRQALQSGLQGLGLSPQMAQAYGSLPESALGPLLKQQMRMQSINDVLSGNDVQSGQQQDNSGMLRQLLGNTDQSGGNFGQVSNQSQQPRGKTYTPEQLTKIAATDPAFANSLRGQQAQQETERHNAEVEKQGRERIQSKEKLEAIKSAEGYEKEIYSAADSAQKTKNELENTRNLVENGDFSNPTMVEVLSRFGLFPDSFKTNDTKKLEASQLSLLKQFRPIVGSQVSDSDLRNLLKRIVGPNMTKEQNKALLDFFEFGLDEPIIRKNIYSDIIQKYQDEGKAPPRQLRSLVDREYSKEMHKRFEALKSEAPEYKELSFGGQKYRGEEVQELPDPKTVPGQKFMVDGIIKISNGVEYVPVHRSKI